jgi:hypothetical protein
MFIDKRICPFCISTSSPSSTVTVRRSKSLESRYLKYSEGTFRATLDRVTACRMLQATSLCYQKFSHTTPGSGVILMHHQVCAPTDMIGII